MNHHALLKEALREIHFPEKIVSGEQALSRSPYHEDIVRCQDGYCAISGQSFFPAGEGYVGFSLPVNKIMYLGHNFGKIRDFTNSVHKRFEKNSTWDGINGAVFKHISEEWIWFTNYYMGFLDAKSNRGSIEHLTTTEYREDCWQFFKLQVFLQRPKIIVVLGGHILRILGAEDRLNLKAWRINENVSIGHLRKDIHSVMIDFEGERIDTMAVAAYHPMYVSGDPAKLVKIEEDARYVAGQYSKLSGLCNRSGEISLRG
jgi:hypothetical protein